MTFKRFSQLWDALVTNRPKQKTNNPIPIFNCNPKTLKALTEYGMGNKTEINKVRKFLGRK